MNEMITYESKIENMIYEIRGKQVMLDRDLAKLYQIETRLLNQKVKRNINRFPQEFCFQMSDTEFKKWRSQTVISNSDKIGLRRPPYVFTEQGIAMLSAIINTNVAVQVSITIMNAFVKMKKYLAENNYEKRISNLETKVIENETKISEIFQKFDKQIDNHIFFEGQIYDAYSLLIDILKEAKESIIIIDNYIDKNILDIIAMLNIKVTIITSDYNKNDIEKYEEQYDNIEVIHSKKFHDRFIILDYKTLYHCGASFKDLGKKCFGINKIKSKRILNELLEVVYE